MSEVIATDKVHDLTQEQARQAEKELDRLWNLRVQPHARLRMVYRLADKFWQAMYKDAAVCSEGCSHCCYVNVNVTLYEAEYIARMAGLPDPDASPNRRRDYTDTPCPFLKDYRCSIYEFRPMACRAFASLDSAEYCADRTWPSHQVTCLSPPGVGGNEVVNQAYEIVLAMNEGYPLKDIREFFGTAPVEVVE